MTNMNKSDWSLSRALACPRSRLVVLSCATRRDTVTLYIFFVAPCMYAYFYCTNGTILLIFFLIIGELPYVLIFIWFILCLNFGIFKIAFRFTCVFIVFFFVYRSTLFVGLYPLFFSYCLCSLIIKGKNPVNKYYFYY